MLPILDAGITWFFLAELSFRFAASPRKARFFFNGWNLFDTVIVVVVSAPSIAAVLVARLLRVFRVLRLVSVVPQLRFLINALLTAIPRMGYIALLMFVIFYIYGAIGSIFFADINPVLWGDMRYADAVSHSDLRGLTDVMYETMAVHPMSWIFYLSFIFLIAFVCLNMMVATILEVMSEEHSAEAAKEAHEREARLGRIEAQLEQITSHLDKR